MLLTNQSIKKRITNRLLALFLYCSRFTLKKKKQYDLCIFTADLLGDLLLASGAIRTLISSFGPSHCILIVSNTSILLAKELFPDCALLAVEMKGGRLAEVLPLCWQHRNRLVGIATRLLVCMRLQRFGCHELYLRWITCAESFGAENDIGSISALSAKIPKVQFTHIISLVQPSEPISHLVEQGLSIQIERYRQIAEAVLCRPIDSSEVIPTITAPHQSSLAHIAVAPLGSESIRSYPDAQLAALLKMIQMESPLPILLLGGPSQSERLQEIALCCNQNGVSARIEATPDMKSLQSVIANSALVISVETFTAHLAAALDRPLVGILGGGHFGLCAPWHRSTRQQWVSHRLPCYNCNWSCTQDSVLCISSISPEALVEASRKAVQSNLPSIDA